MCIVQCTGDRDFHSDCACKLYSLIGWRNGCLHFLFCFVTFDSYMIYLGYKWFRGTAVRCWRKSRIEFKSLFVSLDTTNVMKEHRAAVSKPYDIVILSIPACERSSIDFDNDFSKKKIEQLLGTFCFDYTFPINYCPKVQIIRLKKQKTSKSAENSLHLFHWIRWM